MPGQLKTRIYAPRVKGDLALGLEPSRINGAGEKAWARMDFPGMKLAGQSDQLITEQSITQKFEIGTRRVEYGRTFRYAKAGGALTCPLNARMCANGNWRPGFGGSYAGVNGFWGSLTTQATLGDTSLTLNEQTYTTGTLPRVANYYKDAYLTIFVAPFNTHYIVKSDLGTDTATKIYLDHPILQTTIPIANQVEVNLSPYSKVIDGTGVERYKSFVGMALLEITNGWYFWLQTAGPTWIQPSGWVDARCPGWTVNYRDIYAHIDGSIVSAYAADPSSGFQRVGYLLSATESGYGAAYIMLQLDQ